jgi:hypothetical protein
MVKDTRDKETIIADTNSLLWVLVTLFVVGLSITLVYQDREPAPGCVSFEDALSAGVMSYPDPFSSGHSCG